MPCCAVVRENVALEFPNTMLQNKRSSSEVIKLKTTYLSISSISVLFPTFGSTRRILSDKYISALVGEATRLSFVQDYCCVL